MSARDGLQNEKVLVPTDRKIALIDRLSACGFSRIEATSFVSARWVPQMADAAEVMAGIHRKAGIRYTALTPNLKGFEAACAAKADEVAIFGSASEAFSMANINCSISESLERFKPVIFAATEARIPVRGYISCVVACPYSGAVAPDAVARLARDFLAMGCVEISLGDTTGAGTPETVEAMLKAVLQEVPEQVVAGHYHDTNGLALDNIEASVALGISVFDAAAGGLGGCPYAPGAKGNVDTVAVNRLLTRLGYHTGLDAVLLSEAAAFARGLRAEI
ncbi:hydroxymethylglutaryl-CoA lyase [Aureimonas fodinaquatilis]|uniref:Hydroxymethylglutaryl-CoA lyase n=2 Tax=Aureimonas fodinaquatilis TaxID=2565783 RepID=A0A5B0DTP9_9HYPH|nr:hydroxymethylglutaryl-CoA lyase [Aureimonas fodinaquatilis]